MRPRHRNQNTRNREEILNQQSDQQTRQDRRKAERETKERTDRIAAELQRSPGLALLFANFQNLTRSVTELSVGMKTLGSMLANRRVISLENLQSLEAHLSSSLSLPELEAIQAPINVEEWGESIIVSSRKDAQVHLLRFRGIGKLPLHKHERRVEKIEIISGEARVLFDGMPLSLLQGDDLIFHPGVLHGIENVGTDLLVIKETRLGFLGDDCISGEPATEAATSIVR